jgi:titin
MDINCTSVKRCTYLGSSEYERPTFLNIDPMERITITGSTSSSTFPVSNDALISNVQDHSDDFLMTILPDWSAIQYSTLMGGGDFDQLAGAGSDDKGRIYAAGSTDNENFPTTNDSFDPVNNGFEDVYIFSISLDTPPSPPRNFLATAGDGYVNLTWKTPSTPGSLDLIGYDIYKGETRTLQNLYTTLGNVLHFNDTEVENGKTYYYHIRAKNTALDSLPSPDVQAKPLGPPDAPRNFQAAGGYMKVDLSWEEPLQDGGSSILGYHVFRINDHIEIMFTVDPNETEFSDEAIQAGIEYEYNINAFNIVGESPVSTPMKATPVSEPAVPMNLSLRSGDRFVEISWQPPESSGGMILREYNIYRGVEGSELTLLKNMGANVRKYNDTTVYNGLSYAYNVAAVNMIGESIPTDVIETTPMTFPAAPWNFIISVGDSMVALSWEEPLNDGGSEIIGYRISKIEGEGDPEFIVTGPENEYIDLDVQNGLTYTYSISAVNSVGISPRTQDEQASPAALPEPPEVSIISFDTYHVHIGWKVPTLLGGAELLAYEVYRGISSSELSIVKSLDPDILQYNDTNVVIGIQYFYAVRSVNRVGVSSVSEKISAWAIGVPSAPRDISLEKGDGSITISWIEPEDDGGRDITGYQIQRKDTATGTTMDFMEDGSILIFTDDTVVPGSSYEYTIRAENDIGAGRVSESISGSACRAPSEITGFRATLGDDAVELAWDALDLSETGDVTIEIIRRIDQGESTTIAILDGTETSFTDGNIREGVSYTYTISAYNDAGTSQTTSQEIDTSVDVSPGINTGGVAIMVLGTLIPLIIAGILLFLLIRNRKDNSEKKEETTINEAHQEEVAENIMKASAPLPQQDSVLNPPYPDLQPQMQQILQEPEPVFEQQQVPIHEEALLQEEPNSFLDTQLDQTLPPEIEPSEELIP